MARARIIRGTAGPVSVHPLGVTEDDGNERVIPAPQDDAGEPLPYPRGWKRGGLYKVGVDEFTLTRWRGLALVIDTDGTRHQIRRWRNTRAAAVTATEQACAEKLERLARDREDAEASVAAGDTATTVGTLLERIPELPSFKKLSTRTRGDYEYRIPTIIAHKGGALAAMLPRDVDVATVRGFLESYAAEHGRTATVQAKAILRKALDLAVESTAMKVSFNPCTVLRDAIPNVRIRKAKRDIGHVPTDDEVTAFLVALQDDPRAAPIIGARKKSPHGQAGTVINGTDVADLLAFTFSTGTRVGEASALSWGDLKLTMGAGTADITGTVIWAKDVGTVRQNHTKTKHSTRTVPLRDDIVKILRRRAALFGIDMRKTKHLKLPVFPSPQHHDRWRDPRNLQRAIRAAMDRHGMGYASSHTARRYRITSLLDRGVPLGKVADLSGHTQTTTTLRYVGRGRATDDDVRAAL